jgi:hypothetical protein
VCVTRKGKELAVELDVLFLAMWTLFVIKSYVDISAR